MTAAEWIAKRRELLDAATEGPWLYGGDDWEGATVEMPDDGSGGVAYIATGMRQGPNEGEDDAAFIADARTSLPLALDALDAVLTFATAERDKISRTYIEQPGTAYAGYANAMDDVIRTIEGVLP